MSDSPQPTASRHQSSELSVSASGVEVSRTGPDTDGLSVVQRVSSGETPSAASEQTCPACGTTVVAHAQFCHACGVPLSALPRQESAERRVVTVLFGDLSGFTPRGEGLDPQRVGGGTDPGVPGPAPTLTDI